MQFTTTGIDMKGMILSKNLILTQKTSLDIEAKSKA